ncbi:hypothetical protein OK18_20185 [Chryseobacterium gallinarum]|uniref:Uncharacterized protein n=1 Tax=Chryseobacterium gallinarum TaxID=1324352 RepID=A0A0G3M6W6_CHRGL|nr:hypothetical protein [Chryseobacterium gallinarum]AKK74619.1 hypothetical protein OK18_20185 [Chryseobacterium gallinarum]MCL8538459.1 hypothetical protein [Chryseobacterium gallinarum]
MKKVLLSICTFCFAFFFSQKGQNYLEISYSSVCCGTPSEEPVISSLRQFEKKNKIKGMEILIQSGLGREGEFNLYVGTDKLNAKQKKQLIQNLSAVTALQNGKRKGNSSGFVNFDPTVTVSQPDLMNARNLTIYKNKEK